MTKNAIILLEAELQKKIPIVNYDAFHILFGDLDRNIKLLEDAFAVRIDSTEDSILLSGEDGGKLLQAETAISTLMSDYRQIDRQRIEYVIDFVSAPPAENKERIEDLSKTVIISNFKGRPIRPKTIGQRRYIEAIEKKELVFGIGPAGTGKTFLAVALAIRDLKAGKVQRIIITRPAVEAGENLGFLPGDLQMKVDPYLRPIFDAMHDILGLETFQTLRERGVIEIAPLAYMRGRTLDNAFVILDEAQNTTQEQMKMFLTRFGANSRVVVNGDVTQIDLPRGKRSGLMHAMRVLKGIPEIEFASFSERDVVRHSLVKKIIARYNEFAEKEERETVDERKIKAPGQRHRK